MPNLIELLHQAQRELICPTCGRSFLISEIRPRPHINNSIMLQAVCTNNHFPIVLIFIPPKQLSQKVRPISKRDVTKLSQALDSFEGTFDTVWQGEKPTKSS